LHLFFNPVFRPHEVLTEHLEVIDLLCVVVIENLLTALEVMRNVRSFNRNRIAVFDMRRMKWLGESDWTLLVTVVHAAVFPSIDYFCIMTECDVLLFLVLLGLLTFVSKS
jgi:hypothetical protein